MHATRRQFLAAAAATLAPRLRAGDPASGPAVRFKPGLVTYNVAKDWDLPTLLDICQKAEIAAVECRTTHRHGVEPTLTADERKAVRKRFADSGVVFWGCGSTCEFHSPDPQVVAQNVETCKRFCQLAHDLGGKGVKVRPNGVGRGMTVEQAVAQIGAALKPCGQAASDLGLEIWVEVHGNTTQEPKNMAAIMTACDHPAVGLTWNSNPTDVVNGSVAASFDLLKPWVKSCHVNDFESGYPYAELFGLLASIGYDRYTLCEVKDAVPPEQGVAWLTDYRAKWAKLAGVG